MQYSDPKLRETLAGEYVLGTLRGGARARFERLLVNDAALRTEVENWNRSLAPLAAAIMPVVPAPRVWRQIQQRLRFGIKSSLWERLSFWRGLGFASTAAALLLAVSLTVQLQKPETRSHIAVIGDTQQKSLWLVNAHADKLNIKVVAPVALAANQSFELWMLPRGGRPVSLGLLPSTGEKSVPIAHEIETILDNSSGLAVSLEPAGGSPTGQPTGPVVYQASLLTS